MIVVSADTLYREFSEFLVRRLTEIKEQMKGAIGDHLTYLRGMDAALYACRLRFEGIAKGNVGGILTVVAPFTFPPPREMTDADMACVHAECQQAGREMRELTAPMVAPEKGRAR